MSVNFSTLALSKKYTQDTADQFGALKGASCQIKDIEHENGQSIITFEWENNEGEKRESKLYVQDGTPIYIWESGTSYKYGDLVIYASCFYRCIVNNSDIEFDDTKWNEIGSPDGNYDIVENSSLLPSRFTSADKKMYYSIEDKFFWLWNGETWSPQNTSIFLNKILNAGQTSITFTNLPITDNYIASFYASNGANYTSIDNSIQGQVTVTYPLQGSDITIYLKLEKIQ